eukprot:g42182.t1
MPWSSTTTHGSPTAATTYPGPLDVYMQDLDPRRNSSSPGFQASRGTPLRALFRYQGRDDTRAAAPCSLSVVSACPGPFGSNHLPLQRGKL